MIALVTTAFRLPTETLLEGLGLTNVQVIENFPSLGSSCPNAGARQLSGSTPAQTANVTVRFISLLPWSRTLQPERAWVLWQRCSSDKRIVKLSHAIISWTAEAASGIRILVGIERGKLPANTPQMGVDSERANEKDVTFQPYSTEFNNAFFLCF